MPSQRQAAHVAGFQNAFGIYWPQACYAILCVNLVLGYTHSRNLSLPSAPDVLDSA